MAGFRGTDRIRNIVASARQRLRLVRSRRLKGLTDVTNSVKIEAPASALRHYRIPIIGTAVGLIAIASVAVAAERYVQANSVDYYQVFVAGQPAGEISSQDKVELAIQLKAKELEEADTPIRSVLVDDQVTYQPERAYKKELNDEATLTRVEDMLQTQQVAVKLFVDGKEVALLRDKESADKLLERIKNTYAPKNGKSSQSEVQTLSLSAGGKASAEPTAARVVESVEIMENIVTAETEVEAGAKLTDPDELMKKLLTGNPEPIKYTVVKGDCIGCIAEKLDISSELIYEKNPWIEDDKIVVGDVLDLTELQPMVNVKSVEQVTQTEVIEPQIEYRKSEDMRVGQSKVIRQGKEGKREVTYKLVKKNGSIIEEEIVNQKVLKEAQSTIIMKGTKVVLGEGTGKFAWPVSGDRITSYMGERWGRMHKGIDMIGKSSIMAADNGVIEFVGWKSGLGNTIIIDHKNGFKTVYGHMKSLIAKKGQIVQKGDKIGVMGNTGNSTGTHLHFEVYLNGKLKNPTSYL